MRYWYLLHYFFKPNKTFKNHSQSAERSYIREQVVGAYPSSMYLPLLPDLWLKT